MNVLTTVSYVTIILGIISTIIILIDVIQYPQHMKIMGIVWPITGLYLGPFGIWAYWKLGREIQHQSGHHAQHHHMNHKHHDEKPSWKSIFMSTSHCSAGCVLGDVIGAPIVLLSGVTIAGSMLFADFMVEFILAYLFGIFFQVFSILPISPNLSLTEGIRKAIKADTLSLIAFEIGMFGWMAIFHYLLFTNPPEADHITFWMMMQIAMILGTVTSFPANFFLIKRGIKHPM